MSASPTIPRAEQEEPRLRATRDYYDGVASQYFARHDWPIQRHATRIEERWLRRWIQPGSRVLVVAAGGGREIPVLLDLQCKVTAIDYSEEMVREGIAHNLAHRDSLSWHVADAGNLQDFRHDFDAALCLGALNYFEAPQACLAEMIRCLRPDGLLLVSAINRLHATEADRPSSSTIIRNPYSPEDVTCFLELEGAIPLWCVSHRLWVDRLPSHWNQPHGPVWGKLILTLLLAFERCLQPLYRGRRGKFFWVAGRRPRS